MLISYRLWLCEILVSRHSLKLLLLLLLLLLLIIHLSLHLLIHFLLGHGLSVLVEVRLLSNLDWGLWGLHLVRIVCVLLVNDTELVLDESKWS